MQSSTIIALGNGLHICRQWFCVTLLANFGLYLCLCVKFHQLSFWVPILAAEGPYRVPISGKVGSLFLSMEVPISLGNSATLLNQSVNGLELQQVVDMKFALSL